MKKLFLLGLQLCVSICFGLNKEDIRFIKKAELDRKTTFLITLQNYDKIRAEYDYIDDSKTVRCGGQHLARAWYDQIEMWWAASKRSSKGKSSSQICNLRSVVNQTVPVWVYPDSRATAPGARHQILSQPFLVARDPLLYSNQSPEKISLWRERIRQELRENTKHSCLSVPYWEKARVVKKPIYEWFH